MPTCEMTIVTSLCPVAVCSSVLTTVYSKASALRECHASLEVMHVIVVWSLHEPRCLAVLGNLREC